MIRSRHTHPFGSIMRNAGISAVPAHSLPGKSALYGNYMDMEHMKQKNILRYR